MTDLRPLLAAWLQHAVLERKRSMSGNRRSARLKGRSWSLGKGKRRLYRPIEAKAGKFHRQHRWRGGERIRHRRDSGTDRTEIVRPGIAGMILCSVGIGRRGHGQRDQTTPSVPTAGRVKVTKGQAEIDDQREQREPRSVPHIVPEPAHLPSSRAFSRVWPWQHLIRAGHRVKGRLRLYFRSTSVKSRAVSDPRAARLRRMRRAAATSPRGPRIPATRRHL
jgi:hypothetical protein